MAASTSKDERLAEVMKALGDARQWHESYSHRIDENFKVWRGLVDQRKQYAEWKNQIHPPLIMQVIDTLLANLIDDKLFFTAQARPKLTANAQMLEDLEVAAKAHEILMNSQIDQEPFEDILEDFYLQAMIGNLSVVKNYWRKDSRKVKRRGYREEVLDLPFGMTTPVRMPETLEEEAVRYEGPCSEVVDVRDLWWGPEGITRLQNAEFITHRALMTRQQLRRLQENGVYSGLDKILDPRTDRSLDATSWVTDRERDFYAKSRTKGLIEVLEHWAPERVIVVVDRTVVAATYDNPNWHGEYPFVDLCLRKDFRRIEGISEVEILADIQDGIWTLTNQRLDSTELLNNAVWLLRSDYDGPDPEVGPGSFIDVEDPGQVVPWQPNPMPAQISIPAEQSLMGMLQNLSGAAPFMSGAETSTVDQKTATGISIITSLAQRMMARKKRRAYMALEKIFNQRAWLNRQHIEKPVLATIVGERGAQAFTILPEFLQPDVHFDFEPAAEMMVLQERRAQSQALFQMFLQAAPVLQMMGIPLNARAFAEDLLKSFGKDQVDRYFGPPPPPQMPQGPTPPGVPGAQGAAGSLEQMLAQIAGAGGQVAGSPGNGVTSPLATGPRSPSSQISQSPAVFGQRQLAAGGRQQ